jgi:hypothetical protein
MQLLPKFYAALFAAALAAGAMSPAHAFTLQDGNGNSTKSGAANAAQTPTSPFYDSKKMDLDTKDSGNSLKFGNGGTLTFGPARSPEDDYRDGMQRMFSPLGRPPN